MKATTKRRLAWIAGSLIVAWLGFLGFVDWAMHQPTEKFGRWMAHMPMPAYFLLPFGPLWNQARGGHLNPGDPAPDFTVSTLEARTPVQLASLWTSQPVVLVFGSYT